MAADADGRLENFIEITKSYNKDLVATGTVYAKDALIRWLDLLVDACRGREPVATMRKSITEMVGE
jgi:hypothetical protein